MDYRGREKATDYASASEMTYIVSGGALNSTHSLTMATYGCMAAGQSL